MEPQDNKRDLRIVDESFDLPQVVAAILNLIGYTTMALPFAAILLGLFLGMWGVNQLSDAAAVFLPGWTTLVDIVCKGTKLLLVLMAARSVYLTLTILPPFLPDFIEVLRREFRKKFDL